MKYKIVFFLVLILFVSNTFYFDAYSQTKTIYKNVLSKKILNNEKNIYDISFNLLKNHVAFSSLSEDKGKYINIINLSNLDILKKIEVTSEKNYVVNHLSYSKDGKYLIATYSPYYQDRDISFIKIFNVVNNYSPIKEYKFLDKQYKAFAISPDNKYLVVSKGHEIDIFDFKTMKVIKSFRLDNIEGMGALEIRFAKDSNRFIVLEDYNNISSWDIKKGRVNLNIKDSINEALFINENYLVISKSVSDDNQFSGYFHNLKTNKEKPFLKQDFVFSDLSDDNKIFAVSNHNSIFVFEIIKGQSVRKIFSKEYIENNNDNYIQSIKISLNKKFIYIVRRNSIIEAYKIK